MKKILIVSLLFLGWNLQAQKSNNYEEKNISFGIVAGYINSNLTGKDSDFLASDGKIKNENNFMVGLSLDNPIHKNWGLKHEIFFQNYGTRFERQMNGQVFDATLSMHGLRINPISLAYHIGNFNLYAGPYTNILLNSSITAIDLNGNTYKDHDIYGSENNDQSEGYFLQKMDYGLVVGAEYNFDFGGLIGFQFSRGFATILDHANKFEVSGPDAPRDLKIYNQSFSIFMGYRF